jgi:hypothetical protein
MRLGTTIALTVLLVVLTAATAFQLWQAYS